MEVDDLDDQLTQEDTQGEVRDSEDGGEQAYIHPELRNLAADLDQEELDEIASTVVEDFRLDLESSAEWRTKHGEWTRLYYQKDAPKNPPWEGASTESIPMLAEACNQFHSRAFKAMFPNKKVIKAAPIGKASAQDKERAEKVARHLSWQLMVRDRNYKRNKDRLLLGLPLHGSVFTKTYHDPVKKRNITQNVRCSDLVVPYGTGPRDIEELERKTQVIYMPQHQAAWLHHAEYFVEIPEPYNNEQKTDQDEAHDEISGLSDSGRTDKAHAKVLEQHRFLDLDDDGVPEPYIVWVDCATEKVLRISIRWDTDEMGEATDGKLPVEYFSHYAFIENPDGFYGLGYGHLLGPINTAVNKLLRQVVDAGTLANIGNHSGFISKNLSSKKGQTEMQLGKFVAVENSADDISRGIFQFKFPGPSSTHFNILELLMARGDRLATVTEAITGQTEKVMQPTTVLALIEQSLEVFSTVYERVLSSWQVELEKHYRLNRKFMDPVEYFAINDIGGALQEFEASRDDYEDDLQIEPMADPKMSTDKQKMARAETELNISLQNPLIINSPQNLHAVYKRFYTAIGTENIEEIMPDIVKQQLPRVDDPFMENMGALSPMPAMPAAFPDQDHQLHLEAHLKLKNDPTYGMMLSANGLETLQEHIQAHSAYLYGVAEGNGQNGAGPQAMAQNAGDPGLPGGPSGEVPGAEGLDAGPAGQAAFAPGPGPGG